MGLDMYLNARKYINKVGNWDNVNLDSSRPYAGAESREYRDVINAANMWDIENVQEPYGAEVQVNVAYWRKANQIHNWFVENVQDGEDNCQEYFVSHEKLKKLLEIAREAYDHRDPQLLEPTEGFFFGSTDIDEGYWWDINNTIKQLERITNLEEFDKLAFYYQSSWQSNMSILSRTSQFWTRCDLLCYNGGQLER